MPGLALQHCAEAFHFTSPTDSSTFLFHIRALTTAETMCAGGPPDIKQNGQLQPNPWRFKVRHLHEFLASYAPTTRPLQQTRAQPAQPEVYRFTSEFSEGSQAAKMHGRLLQQAAVDPVAAGAPQDPTQEVFRFGAPHIAADVNAGPAAASPSSRMQAFLEDLDDSMSLQHPLEGCRLQLPSAAAAGTAAVAAAAAAADLAGSDAHGEADGAEPAAAGEPQEQQASEVQPAAQSGDGAQPAAQLDRGAPAADVAVIDLTMVGVVALFFWGPVGHRFCALRLNAGSIQNSWSVCYVADKMGRNIEQSALMFGEQQATQCGSGLVPWRKATVQLLVLRRMMTRLPASLSPARAWYSTGGASHMPQPPGQQPQIAGRRQL
jgi:hypothetical protein